MKFNWRRTIAPILLVAGLLLCISHKHEPGSENMGHELIGFGIFLVAFALIIGFSRNDKD